MLARGGWQPARGPASGPAERKRSGRRGHPRGDHRRSAPAWAAAEGGGAGAGARDKPDAGTRGAPHARERGPRRVDPAARGHSALVRGRRPRRRLPAPCAPRGLRGAACSHAHLRGRRRPPGGELRSVRPPAGRGRPARPREGEPALPQRHPRGGRERPARGAHPQGDRDPARLQVLLLVLAGTEAHLAALPPPADARAEARGRRTGRADHEGARARGAGLPARQLGPGDEDRPA